MLLKHNQLIEKMASCTLTYNPVAIARYSNSMLVPNSSPNPQLYGQHTDTVTWSLHYPTKGGCESPLSSSTTTTILRLPVDPSDRLRVVRVDRVDLDDRLPFRLCRFR